MSELPMKPPKRPIDAQDMPWSYIGKDELDKSAEHLWEFMRAEAIVWDDIDHGPERPYHVISSGRQEKVQRAVLSVLGTTVPDMLLKRAEVLKGSGFSDDETWALRDMATELKARHG